MPFRRDTSHYSHECYMQVNTLTDSDRSVSPSDWASTMREEIRQSGGIMNSLTDLASFSFTCVIGCRVQHILIECGT